MTITDNSIHTPHTTQSPPLRPPARDVGRLINRRSFATLATVSPAGRPHVAGVLYQATGDALFLNTLATSRRARNIAANPHVGVCIPVRRLPVGPPSTVHFQTTAELLAGDDPRIVALLDTGELDSITGHGELELPDSVFVRIAMPARLLTHGLGLPLRKLIADPIAAGGVVEMSEIGVTR